MRTYASEARPEESGRHSAQLFHHRGDSAHVLPLLVTHSFLHRKRANSCEKDGELSDRIRCLQWWMHLPGVPGFLHECQGSLAVSWIKRPIYVCASYSSTKTYTGVCDFISEQGSPSVYAFTTWAIDLIKRKRIYCECLEVTLFFGFYLALYAGKVGTARA